MSDDADALEKSMAGRGHRSATYGVILFWLWSGKSSLKGWHLRKDLTDASHAESDRWTFDAKGTGSAKALKWEYALVMGKQWGGGQSGMKMSESVVESEIPGGARVTRSGRAGLAIGPSWLGLRGSNKSLWRLLHSNVMVWLFFFFYKNISLWKIANIYKSRP